jgi:hypothetical protein
MFEAGQKVRCIVDFGRHPADYSSNPAKGQICVIKGFEPDEYPEWGGIVWIEGFDRTYSPHHGHMIDSVYGAKCFASLLKIVAGTDTERETENR